MKEFRVLCPTKELALLAEKRLLELGFRWSGSDWDTSVLAGSNCVEFTLIVDQGRITWSPIICEDRRFPTVSFAELYTKFEAVNKVKIGAVEVILRKGFIEVEGYKIDKAQIQSICSLLAGVEIGGIYEFQATQFKVGCKTFTRDQLLKLKDALNEI